MRITVNRDGYPHITTDELMFASRFMLRLMVSEEVHETISLTLHLDFHDKKRYGLLVPKEHDNPRRFAIHLHPKQRYHKLLHTLAHELVHLKQMALGEMGATTLEKKNRIHTRWHGVWVDDESMHYYDLPWEIEAHGREIGLVKRYKKFVKEHKIVFEDE